MHPDPLYHSDDRAMCENLIDRIGFGVVFAATPDGPRAAHTPLLLSETGTLQFHLARSNALARHLARHSDGASALIVVNGPDGYVSPRWYANRDTVPTWDYIALECEGRTARIDDAALEAFLHGAIAKHEGRLEGAPWEAAETSPRVWAGLFRGIIGFEMEVAAWRPTIKLSQNKTPAERAAIAAGLEAAGMGALGALVQGTAA